MEGGIERAEEERGGGAAGGQPEGKGDGRVVQRGEVGDGELQV